MLRYTAAAAFLTSILSSMIVQSFQLTFQPLVLVCFVMMLAFQLIGEFSFLTLQALLFHRLGRSWRKPLDKVNLWIFNFNEFVFSHHTTMNHKKKKKSYLLALSWITFHPPNLIMQPLDREYVEILHLFGDSESSAFSIHNLLRAGKAYGLAAGSWVGPYAVCHSWESLVRSRREETNLEYQSLSMAVYVVSGSEDGERGGAPVLCIEEAARHCSELSKGQEDWTPILLLVPLVLGLDKINPRFVIMFYTYFHIEII